MEVHPPEHPIFTWKQFFIHMSTICLGLLIALGLEHIAELVHQHEQVKQANEALQREIRANVLESQLEAIEVRREYDVFTGDLAALVYLRSHPHAPLNQLPAPLVWGMLANKPSTAAWDVLRASPVAALIPVHQMESTANRYELINRLNDQEIRVWDAAVRAREYSFLSPDPRSLTTADLDRWIAAVEDLLAEHFKEAIYLENLCDLNADIGFKPCITKQELDAWGHTHRGQELVSIYGAAGQAFNERNHKWIAQINALESQANALDTKK